MSDDKTRLPDDEPKGSLLSEGQTFGQYKVIRLLGRGGMGEVYEVENPVLEKRYALKLLNKEIMSRPDAAERFKREAKVMARFDHPNIVKVDDFGEIEGHAGLRMELVCGFAATNLASTDKTAATSLSDLLTGEPLPEPLVIDLLKQILNGLAYAHEQGVVHRDIKPSNILLSSESEGLSVPLASLPVRCSLGGGGSSRNITPKITDFGLVRLAGEQWLQSQVQLTVARSMVDSTSSPQADTDATRLDASDSSKGTSTQALLGTFEFMSPEQKKGQEATEQSDLYSVSLIAFRMLTGEDTLGMRRPSEIVDGLSTKWDVWILRALETQPGKRYENAESMRLAMPDGSQPVPSKTEPPKTAPAVRPVAENEEGGKQRSGFKTLLLVLITLGLVAGVFLLEDREWLPLFGYLGSLAGAEDNTISIRDIEGFRSSYVYTLQRGDSFFSISKHFDMPLDQFYELNGLNKNSIPRIGQEVLVRQKIDHEAFDDGRGYIVQRGDSLSKIAADHNVTITEIKEANGMTGDVIRVGQELSIPKDDQVYSERIQVGEDFSLDLGGGEKLVLVWITALNGWVGKYEVTNGQYRRFKSDHSSGDYKGHSLNGDDQPVVEVSFKDAEAFTKWLNGKFASELPSGYRFGLPSKQQWVTYTQCGDERKYPWGNDWPPKYGNYHGQEGAGSWMKLNGYRDNHVVTTSVSSSGRNDWGLYGVGGNVLEWTSEIISDSSHVVRGASWSDGGEGSPLILGVNLGYGPSAREFNIGFRVCLFR